ncbi:MAG: hypothetical protein CMB46_02660 [Euryarchaeota archaeon]|nr:hypothetical protein [Euryarchaeota archaeon]
MSLKPRLPTLVILVIGEFIFGLGDSLLIAAGIGNTPWTVLAEGISYSIEATIGEATFLVSAAVLLLWIPLREIPGIGTILNAIIIAWTIHVMVPILPTPESQMMAVFMAALGIVLVGIGSGLYLTSNLGPGPRDGWMTGLQRKTGIPIGRVRAAIEITVVLVGWYLGGTVGLGTVAFALTIGPVVAICLDIAGRIGEVTEAKGV